MLCHALVGFINLLLDPKLYLDLRLVPYEVKIIITGFAYHPIALEHAWSSSPALVNKALHLYPTTPFFSSSPRTSIIADAGMSIAGPEERLLHVPYEDFIDELMSQRSKSRSIRT